MAAAVAAVAATCCTFSHPHRRQHNTGHRVQVVTLGLGYCCYFEALAA